MKKYVKFALDHFNVKAKVKVKLKNIKNLGETHHLGEGRYLVVINKKAPHWIQRQTAFHEAVHIKQYELDGLYLTDELYMFKGERFDLNTEYYWLPWEIEARGMEEALLNEWHIQKKKKKS